MHFVLNWSLQGKKLILVYIRMKILSGNIDMQEISLTNGKVSIRPSSYIVCAFDSNHFAICIYYNMCTYQKVMHSFYISKKLHGKGINYHWHNDQKLQRSYNALMHLLDPLQIFLLQLQPATSITLQDEHKLKPNRNASHYKT